MREFARQSSIRNPIGVRLDKWGLERRRTLEEKRARKATMEEERVQMQVLNDHVVAFLAFKCNIIALLTYCISYMKGLDVARTIP